MKPEPKKSVKQCFSKDKHRLKSKQSLNNYKEKKKTDVKKKSVKTQPNNGKMTS